ncbi:hypothetical protein CASFOL_003296 [Castilleja foliolosa]|uniref:Uncharacterized protein n=1 Tax=Castilleja foliolosa TaxID=1961234 RepID=A0ABD3EH40_9LAMI
MLEPGRGVVVPLTRSSRAKATEFIWMTGSLTLKTVKIRAMYPLPDPGRTKGPIHKRLHPQLKPLIFSHCATVVY